MPVLIHERLPESSASSSPAIKAGSESYTIMAEDGDFGVASIDSKLVIATARNEAVEPPLEELAGVYQIPATEAPEMEDLDKAFLRQVCVKDNLVALIMPGKSHTIDFIDADDDPKQLIIEFH